MKLKESREIYYFNSGKASDIVRQLALAGIALIWIFKTDIAGQPRLPTELVWPAILIVIGLGIDLLQYVVASIIWGTFGRQKEKSGVGIEEEFEAPRELNWPGLVFYGAKVSVIGLAYGLLGIYLVHKLA